MPLRFDDDRGGSSKLSDKQQAFCRAYIENGGNASMAYRSCYAVTKMKPASINREAKALLDNPKITTRLAELRKVSAHRHAVTVDSLVAELEAVRAKAMLSPQGGNAAVSAIMGKAKLLGLVVEKAQVTALPAAPVRITSKMSMHEAAQAYAAKLNACRMRAGRN